MPVTDAYRPTPSTVGPYRLLEPLSVTLGVACTLVGAVDDPEDA